MNESTASPKPGIKTTEFWITLITAFSAGLAAVIDLLPEGIAAWIVAVVVGIYSFSRAIVKAIAPGKLVPGLLLCLALGLGGCSTIPVSSARNLIETSGADHRAYLSGDSERDPVEVETQQNRWDAFERLVGAAEGGKGE